MESDIDVETEWQDVNVDMVNWDYVTGIKGNNSRCDELWPWYDEVYGVVCSRQTEHAFARPQMAVLKSTAEQNKTLWVFTTQKNEYKWVMDIT